MQVVVVGGGIGGLSLALALHSVGIDCKVFEAATDIQPLGVGLNLLPHAVSELTALGVLPELLKRGVETREVGFYTRHGQLVYKEPRGQFAGYPVPQISIHRADLHESLLQTVTARLGPGAVELGHRCVGVKQTAKYATASFATSDGRGEVTVDGDMVVACDGIHSVVRKQMYPQESSYRFHGTVQYRGVTRWRPFLTGASMAYVGTFTTGKLVVYPIRKNIDEQGRDLINWVVEVAKEDCGVRDWNRRAGHEDFISGLLDWNFDWLDVPEMIKSADSIYEYPVVDQDPLPSWTLDRVTLLGDAAHPMLPRGSNGAAQAILDANVLANILSEMSDPVSALRRYEEQRLPATSQIVLTNRDRYPDAILRVVEERTGGRPFQSIDDVMSRDEILQWQEGYKTVAGFRKDQVEAKQARAINTLP